jgi:hypothetical protein
MQQSQSRMHPALLASRKIDDFPAQQIGDIEVSADLIDPRREISCANPVPVAEKLKVRPHAEGRVHSDVLWRAADAPPQAPAIRKHIEIVHPSGSGIRISQARQDGHECCLARAIWADQPANLSLRHRQINPAEHMQGSIGFLKSSDFKHCASS